MITVTPPHKPRIPLPTQPFRRIGQTAVRGAERAGTWADETLQGEERILEPDARGRKRILRQPVVNRLVHWLVALSTFSLFFSGFGQMPLYKRYMLSEVPGMAWTADYGVTLLLHYIGAAVLIFALSFHVWYHGLLRRAFGFLPRRGDIHESALIIRAIVTGRGEPPSMKYLAEQRLAYAGIGIALLLVVLSGIVKVVKNLPGVGLPELVVEAATMLHNASAIVLLLLIVAHLAALLVPSNRKLVGAMFHGKVDRNYIEHRHTLWYRELTAHTSDTMSATPLVPSSTTPPEEALPSGSPPVTLEAAAPVEQPMEPVPANPAPPPSG